MSLKNTLCVKPTQEFPLGHRAYYMRVAPNGQSVAASKDGEVSVMSETLERSAHFVLPHGIGSVCLSSDSSRIVVTHEGGIKTLDAATGKELLAVPGSFHDAWFDEEKLWVIRNCTNDLVVVELRSAVDLSLQLELEVRDPHFSSSWAFYPPPWAGTALLWAAAGQDGQTSFWLNCTADAIEIFEDLPDDTTPPSFSQDGEELLVCNEDEISRYKFPEGTLLATISPEGEMRFGYDLHYLSSTTALVVIGEGLLRLLDLDAMHLGKVIEIEGHEPKQTWDLYPSLAGDDEIISNLAEIYRQGKEYFISSHLVLPGSSNQKHVIVRWRNPILPPTF